MKRKLLHSINSLIVLLISLLGFTTSCEEDAEYGTPHAKFIVDGKVTSESDNKPIPEIIIEMHYVADKVENNSQSTLISTSFSYYGGDYSISTQSDPNDQAYRLRFIDTDGPLNGAYETLDTTVVFKDPKFVNGDGSWYMGITEKELNIKLKLKE